jgi:hypothetical protein
MTTYAIAKVVHLLAVSLWIGGGLLAVLDARGSIRLGRPHVEAFVGRMKGAASALIIAGIIVVATGFWLIVLKGGFRAVSPRVHAGLGVTILVFAVAPFTLGTLARLRDAAVRDDGAAIQRLGWRFVRLARVEEILRLVVLVLMVSQE